MISTSRRWTVAAAALAALGAGLPARGQDGGGGEAAGGHIPDPMEFTDRDKTIKITLPRSWQARRVDGPGIVAGFNGWFGEVHDPDKPETIVTVELTHAFSRAGLARNHLEVTNGTAKPGTLEKGAGWQQVAVEHAKDPVVDWFHVVEKDGFVYIVRARAFKGNYELFHPTVAAVLNSFEPTATPPAPATPDGWKSTKGKDVVFLTDSEDKFKLNIAQGLVEAIADVLREELKGKARTPDPARVLLYQNAAVFETRGEAAGIRKPDDAYFDSRTGELCISLLGAKADAFIGGVNYPAAEQQIWRYFGGRPPYWVERGLAWHADIAARSGGKPDRPEKTYLQNTRRHLAKSEPLNAYFRLRPESLSERFKSGGSVEDDSRMAASIMWGWHWFFRYAKEGRKYRKGYDAYLKSLQETGDPDAAEEAWGKTDFDKMLEDFKAFGSEWGL